MDIDIFSADYIQTQGKVEFIPQTFIITYKKGVIQVLTADKKYTISKSTLQSFLDKLKSRPRNRDYAESNYLLQQIYAKHTVNGAEKLILEGYLKHIHKESKIAFLRKILSKDQAYLRSFIDDELENAGNDIYQAPDTSIAEKRVHKDLYDAEKSNDTAKIFTIYTQLLNRIRELPKDGKQVIYRKLGYMPSEDLDIKQKRVLFFEAFLNYLKGLKDSLPLFIDNLFTADIGLNVAFGI